MAKKKIIKQEKSYREVLKELAELAGKLNLADDALDGDLRDAADEEANLIYDNIKDAVMLEKLEFLYMHGYQLGRLREIIEELAAEGNS